jgi:hypothetical protein
MRLQPEQIDHINIVNWFNYQYPDLADDLHHFANERHCSIQQGKLLKRMGVKKGVADFFLALPQGRYSGLWVELKVGKNKPTKEQIAFAARKTARGYHCAIVWGFEAACEIIKTYLIGYKTNRVNSEPKNLYNGKPIC